MTGAGDDESGIDDSPSHPDEGEGLDELVEPSVDLRTAQEKDAASDDASGGASESPTHGESGSEATDGGSESESEAEGLDELVEPSVDLRTAQEKEAASASDEEAGDAGGGDRDA